METSKNIGDAILAYKELSGKSYSECAESLELARSTLKECAAGRGNPNMSTLEHLANKMGVRHLTWSAVTFPPTRSLSQRNCWMLQDTCSNSHRESDVAVPSFLSSSSGSLLKRRTHEKGSF